VLTELSNPATKPFSGRDETVVKQSGAFAAGSRQRGPVAAMT
jgi:hypothetical protein